MSDIRKLKKHLEELFDEGYTHPSDIDIFAQAEQYEYALSEQEDVSIKMDPEMEGLEEAPGAIRKGIAAVALLAGLWGVNDHLAKKAYDSSPQLQQLTAHLEVAKEYNDTRMIAQLEDRIKNHKMRLDLGKGDVMGPDGRPIEVTYDKDITEVPAR